MGYAEFFKTQNRINKTQGIWEKIKESPDKYKSVVESKAKVVFYEDLYNKLSKEDKEEFETLEDFKESLKTYFKFENISYNVIKSYKEFVIKKFENGYLWEKITTDKKYDKYFKEIEFIDKDNEYKSTAIFYPKMFDAVNHTYPKIFKTKREMKKVLETYFSNNNVNYTFINEKEDFDNYSKSVINEIIKKK